MIEKVGRRKLLLGAQAANLVGEIFWIKRFFVEKLCMIKSIKKITNGPVNFGLGMLFLAEISSHPLSIWLGIIGTLIMSLAFV